MTPDSGPARNRARVGGPVDYVHADVFDWTPPRRFDVCFFSFWLSHVPDERLASFWAKVDAAVRPGGRVFLIDSHEAGDAERPVRTQQRVLDDGRWYTVVKRFWLPAELTAHAAWALDACVTRHDAILYASGQRVPSARG